ncbi:unnamed protein product [Periconia digitata]|uniref:Uncharacterized protein n=1 Tax=Periconia digitata TaxID=1303443 RepID=A0A9W4XEL6_9PLEO|nr:unnamed protein product [Periconia digitata]
MTATDAGDGRNPSKHRYTFMTSEQPVTVDDFSHYRKSSLYGERTFPSSSSLPCNVVFRTPHSISPSFSSCAVTWLAARYFSVHLFPSPVPLASSGPPPHLPRYIAVSDSQHLLILHHDGLPVADPTDEYKVDDELDTRRSSLRSYNITWSCMNGKEGLRWAPSAADIFVHHGCARVQEGGSIAGSDDDADGGSELMSESRLSIMRVNWARDCAVQRREVAARSATWWFSTARRGKWPGCSL